MSLSSPYWNIGSYCMKFPLGYIPLLALLYSAYYKYAGPLASPYLASTDELILFAQ